MTTPTRDDLTKLLTDTSIEELQDAESFYAGNQWEPSTIESRRVSGRPTITINRIATIVRDAQIELEFGDQPLTSAQRVALILWAVRSHRDAQKLYNYFVSAFIENIKIAPEVAAMAARFAQEIEPSSGSVSVKAE